MLVFHGASRDHRVNVLAFVMRGIPDDDSFLRLRSCVFRISGQISAVCCFSPRYFCQVCTIRQSVEYFAASLPTLLLTLPTDQISPFSGSKLICTWVKLTQTSPWMGPSYSERSNGPLNCSFGVTFLKPRKGYWAVKLAPCHLSPPTCWLYFTFCVTVHFLSLTFYFYFDVGWVLPHC